MGIRLIYNSFLENTDNEDREFGKSLEGSININLKTKSPLPNTSFIQVDKERIITLTF